MNYLLILRPPLWVSLDTAKKQVEYGLQHCDTFGGCVLHHILQWGLEGLTEGKLRKMLTFANAGASIITTRKSALSVMPSEDEIFSRNVEPM